MVTASRRLCSVDGCERTAEARGWCGTHYMRWKRHGDPPINSRDPAQRLPPAVCSVEGCDALVQSRGWCSRHYARWLKYGDPLTTRRDPPNPDPPAVCTVDGCEKLHVSRGLCRMHYSRMYRGKPLGTAAAQRNPDALCLLDGCGRRARMWGYCTLHGQRFRVHGDPEVLGWGTLDDDTETVLYRLWNRHGELLYVGVTVDVHRRIAQHQAVQP